MATEAIGEHASLADMIVNFFTTDDFVGLLSRSAMLPLDRLLHPVRLLPSRSGGRPGFHVIGKFLDGLTEVMMAFVQIITYYAPIAFFALFADLVATYGSERGLRLWPGHGGLLSPVLYLHLHRLSPLRLISAAARHGIEHYVPAHRKALPSCRWAPAPPSATIPTNLA